MSVPHCMLSNAWSIPPLPAPVTRPIPRSRDEAGTTTTTGAVAAVEAKAAQPGVDAVLIVNAGVLLLLLLLVVRDVDVDVAQTTHPRIDAVREKAAFAAFAADLAARFAARSAHTEEPTVG